MVDTDESDRVPLVDEDLNTEKLITVRLIERTTGKLKATGKPCPKFICKGVDGILKDETINVGIITAEALTSMKQHGWKSKSTNDIYFEIPEPSGESEVGESGIKWLNSLY